MTKFELFSGKPVNPSFGDTYLDLLTGRPWVWDGVEWVPAPEQKSPECDCTGPLDLLMTIEDNSVTKMYHPACQREVTSEFWAEGLSSDGPIPVRGRWESEKDWETGYTEGWLVIEAPRKDQP